VSAKVCARCSRPLWFKGTPPEERPAGSAVHSGHGLCTTCYARAQRAGDLPRKASAVSRPERPCDRCGIGTTELGLCADCRDVLELDEQHPLLEAVS
jgi:hypothetical protein